MTTITSLPTVIRITSVTDAGEKDGATCPHCGASGRYIYHFDCADGISRAAMKGCFSHFPKHSFVELYAKLMDKRRENEKKGWKMAAWDIEMIEAIDSFVAGTLTQKAAKSIIESAKLRRNQWIDRKYR